MIRLALLRHGHTAWNRAHRIQGRTDIPLDDQAVAGLRALRLPAPWDSAQLWSSPLQRAAHTAELVAGRMPRTDPALMEMDWGDWEGQHGSDLRADPASGFRDIEDWSWDYAPPGGESPAQLRARLVPWAEALTRDSVAVCHIGVMRVLLAQATGWNFDGPAPFAVKRNRLFIINISDGVWSFDSAPVRLEARP
ncbi:histidine phosphatase family protein [Sulfitobacter sp. 20_GPM-1509m]|uniref:histidine phosphatase family protein n=1 Tax=Sulfitobacter sp. 20_GPM-1509m TaxID=1380367 RepID=UPI00048CDEF4|nr:histidine phosphatase family protein [Sulfitobacter sp. 20_GPM-1509m]